MTTSMMATGRNSLTPHPFPRTGWASASGRSSPVAPLPSGTSLARMAGSMGSRPVTFDHGCAELAPSVGGGRRERGAKARARWLLSTPLEGNIHLWEEVLCR